MRVDNPIWRNVVLRLVVETDAVVIDVTTPGESLLWEIETVGPRVRRRWVLVGELERLRQLAQFAPGDPTPDGRLADLLDGETIVSYRVGQNVKPFQRALRARYRLVTRPGFEHVRTRHPSPTDLPSGPLGRLRRVQAGSTDHHRHDGRAATFGPLAQRPGSLASQPPLPTNLDADGGSAPIVRLSSRIVRPPAGHTRGNRNRRALQ